MLLVQLQSDALQHCNSTTRHTSGRPTGHNVVIESLAQGAADGPQAHIRLSLTGYPTQQDLSELGLGLGL